MGRGENPQCQFPIISSKKMSPINESGKLQFERVSIAVVGVAAQALRWAHQ
jgi:hypothetical protein